MIKTIALGIFVLATLVSGGLLVQDKRQLVQQSARIVELQTQVAGQREEIRKGTAATAEVEQKRVQLAARAKAARQSLLEARAAAASAPPPPTAAGSPDARDSKNANPFGSSIAKMMKDPAMKNMMRTTQANALRQMYGDLVKQWSLSPDETKTFYDVLLDKQMDQMDQGMQLMENGPGAASAAVAGDPDAKLKASLGDDLYKQYQDYEKTIPGRLVVTQLQQQLAGNNVPALTPDQTNLLVQTVTEESANQPAGSFIHPSGAGGNPFGMDPAQVDQYMKTQGELNDRVDARMADVLSAEQLQAFKDEQQQMLAAQRMGMEMAAKMMGPSPTP